MLKSGFASGLDQTSGQNPVLNRRSFLLAMTSLLALGLPQEAKAADFTPFTFAFISDVHLCTGLGDGMALLQESQLFLQDAMAQLNKRKLDFIVFGGDQVEGPGKNDVFWNLFIDVLQTANAPWFFVLGESDVSGLLAVDKMLEYGPDLKGRGLTSGKPYWSADPVSNVHLVGLDTSKPNTSTGDISNEQLAWLKADLEANRNKFTLVCSHHPLLAPPPYDGGPPWDDYMVLQGASAREILGGSRDVRLCISGHVPVNKVQQEGGIWYVSAATLAIYPCQFKIFTVSPQAVHMETLQVSHDQLVKKAKKIMETSRIAFQYSSTRPQSFIRVAEGEEIDRNALLPLVSAAVSQQKAEKKKGKEKKTKEEKSSSRKSKNHDQENGSEKVDDKEKSGSASSKPGPDADKDATKDAGKSDSGDLSPKPDKSAPPDKSVSPDKSITPDKSAPADKINPADNSDKSDSSAK